MNRKKAITWMRALAALLILNSHMELLYPEKIRFLGFGGLFGNMVFIFISGYCLSNIRQPFGQWLTKRVVRVYLPYLLFLPVLFLLGSTAGMSLPVLFFPIGGEYHFIASILTLYPVYFCLAYLQKAADFLSGISFPPPPF